MSSPIQYTAIVPAFETWDMEATLDFYVNILGFAVDSKMDNEGKVFWAMLRRNNIWLMFSDPNKHIGNKTPKFTGQLYIYTNDVDSVWTFVKDKVKIAYPIDNFNYGMREFGIYDNNGYLIAFGKPIDTK
jgi:uncharacterized glyoxalase superfamily protein PhnB